MGYEVADKRSISSIGGWNWVDLNNALKGIVIAGVLAAVAIGVLPASAATLVQNRITAPIRSSEMQPLHGTVHPKVAISEDKGQLSGSTAIQGISLVFSRSAAQEADLKQLLVEQQTKGSPMYHQWLRPGQFAARYGVSQQDLAKVAAWLKSQGFTVNAIPASVDRVIFSGTAAQVNAAFQTEMHQYSLNGRMHWANATEVSVPQAIAGMTRNVEHLNTFRPRPHIVQHAVRAQQQPAPIGAKPNYTLSCTPNQDGCPASGLQNFIAPSDSQTIYDVTGLYNNSITGTGQTLGIMGQTDITTYETDIANFRSLSGLNASNLPTQILVPNSGSNTDNVFASDLAEADIDTEWSGAIAENATILYVTVGNDQNSNVFDSLEYAIDTPLASSDTNFIPVLSISYGGCEQEDFSSSYIQGLEQVLEQANAQGQTVVASSGDDGSAACDDSDTTAVPASKGLSVSYPASSQYVTAAGGTSFSGDLTDQAKYWNSTNNADNGSAISYIPETTWNDTPNQAGLTNSGSLSASGGGASALFSKPSWQVGTGVPSDSKRDVPDISLAADPNHDGYVLCTEQTNSAGTQVTGPSTCVYPVGSGEIPYFPANGEGYLYGGTSIAAPQLAAMITLWNQKAGNTSGVGNANSIFYVAAQNTPTAFHDITTGSNAVVCQQGSPDCVSNGAGGYVMSCCSAGAGYDEATGLGSVDATALGAVWPAITVTPVSTPQPTFTMVATASAVSVAPGSTGTDTLILSPSGAGANSQPGFSGTVSLACSNLPAGVTCSFAPSSAALSPGTPQSVTLTFSATSAASLRIPEPVRRGWPMETMLAGFFGLTMLGIGRKRRFPSRWASRWMTVLLLGIGLMAATALTACGGSGTPSSSSTSNPSPTTPTATSTTVTVTGTSSNITVTDKITLTVSS